MSIQQVILCVLPLFLCKMLHFIILSPAPVIVEEYIGYIKYDGWLDLLPVPVLNVTLY